MAGKHHFGMDLADWLHEMDGLGLVAGASVQGQEPALLRRFCWLLDKAPSPDLLDGLGMPVLRHIDTLIQAAALESAVMGFLAPETGFCLSRGGDGDYLASIILPRRLSESSARGASMALACLGALAMGLTDLAPRMTPQSEHFSHKNGMLH
jgi:hypothetical protein